TSQISTLSLHDALPILAALCPLTEFNCRATFDQADRQLQTFGRMTGGKAYSPIFSGQFRDIFSDIGQTIRNQYVISYHPTNRARSEEHTSELQSPYDLV